MSITELQSHAGRLPATAAEVVGKRRPVVVVEPERMNVLGLMLANLLERRLTNPDVARHVRALRGDVLLDAGGMQASLRFGPDRVFVTRGVPRRARAEIRGTLTAFFDAALGRHRARNVLAGRLGFRGNPLVLWHLLELLRA